MIGLAALSLAVFFRYDLVTGFNLTFSDVIDGTIEVSILEHWFNVFRGLEHWSQMMFLYPARAALGYNDGYLLFGIVYAGFRWLGCDPFLAAECVNVIVKLAGFAGMLWFARLVLRAPVWAACVAAAVFTVSNGSYIQGSHNQLFSVAFAPVLGAMAYAAWQAASSGRRMGVLLWGVGCAALFASWLLTSFYLAWFFALFALVFVLVLLALSDRDGRRRLQADARACWLPLCAVGVALVLCLLPVALLYLPKAAETGMHGVDEMSSYLLAPLDIVYLGRESLVWGWLDRWLGLSLSAGSEHITGFPPLLLVLFALGAAKSLYHRANAVFRISAALAVATGICWLLALQVGGVSLWQLIYRQVPGAGAVRVVSRIQLFLEWPLTSVAAVGLGAVPGALPRWGRTASRLAAVLAIMAITEQVNLVRIARLDRAAQMAWLRAIPPPPAGCRVFLVTRGRPEPDPLFGQALNDLVIHDVDAMIISEWRGLPTVNGYDSVTPRDWNLLSIDRPDYLARARHWAALHNVSAGLCGLDLLTNRWTASPLGSG